MLDLTIHICSCGTEPILMDNSDYHLVEDPIYWVQCPMCGKTAVFDIQSSKEAAIGSWNSQFQDTQE